MVHLTKYLMFLKLLTLIAVFFLNILPENPPYLHTILFEVILDTPRTLWSQP